MSLLSRRTAERLGILLHGSKIWISELTGIYLLSAIILFLFALIFVIFINVIKIHNCDKQIFQLTALEWSQTKMLEMLVEQERIGAAIKSQVGTGMPERVYYQLVKLVYNNSRTFGYDPLLLLAVIRVESVFKPEALGRNRNSSLSGAIGLMQIKPETAMEIAATLEIPIKTKADLLRPDINLAIGVAYLTKLIGSFRSFKLGLLAYNQGPAVIKGYLHGENSLSIDYYNKVLKHYYLLQQAVDQRKQQ
jgi:hypothetical protein